MPWRAFRREGEILLSQPIFGRVSRFRRPGDNHIQRAKGEQNRVGHWWGQGVEGGMNVKGQSTSRDPSSDVGLHLAKEFRAQDAGETGTAVQHRAGAAQATKCHAVERPGKAPVDGPASDRFSSSSTTRSDTGSEQEKYHESVSLRARGVVRRLARSCSRAA